MTRSVHRVLLSRGYVLHRRPFRDSSLILEVFSREHGRLTVFARAARGPKSRLAALQPFQPLLLSWAGRGEAPQLSAAENAEMALALPGSQLMSAFYLNELLLKLLTRHDPYPELFDCYEQALAQLRLEASAEWPLRRFEARLLDLIGYGLSLGFDAEGTAIEAGALYQFRSGVHGLLRAEEPVAPREAVIGGQALLDLAAGLAPRDELALKQARALMRCALDDCLEGRQLATRTVARALAHYPRKERTG